MLAGFLLADEAKLSERPVRSPSSQLGGAGDSPGGGSEGLEGTLERARLGDRAAFADLYESLGPDVERLCRRLLGASVDAQDARNEIFLRAHANFARYDARQPFRRWLLAVSAHHCIDLLRRRRVEERIFDAAELDENELSASTPSPLRVTLDRERQRRLLQAVDALPDRYRVPIVLRYFADLSYEAMAEVLQVSTGQVGTLLFRAKARLRQSASGEESPR